LFGFVPVTCHAPQTSRDGNNGARPTSKQEGNANILFRLGLAGSAEDDRALLIVFDEAGDVGRLKGEAEEGEEDAAVMTISFILLFAPSMSLRLAMLVSSRGLLIMTPCQFPAMWSDI
jgi:hypothetical protein